MAGMEGMDVDIATDSTENEESIQPESENNDDGIEQANEQLENFNTTTEEISQDKENEQPSQENLESRETESQPHNQAAEQAEVVIRLPVSRIKTIIKMDPEVTLASKEAVATIAKATELFIGALSKDASYKTLEAKRKTLLRKDLEHIFDARDCYAFLEGTMES